MLVVKRTRSAKRLVADPGVASKHGQNSTTEKRTPRAKLHVINTGVMASDNQILSEQKMPSFLWIQSDDFIMECLISDSNGTMLMFLEKH